MRLKNLSLSFALLLAIACGSATSRNLANAGDWERLRARLSENGEISRSELRDLGKAVLRRGLSTAGGRSGEDFVASLSSCALDVDGELAERSAKRDDVAYAAALLRLETGRGSFSAARALGPSSIPGEFALFARSLVSREDGKDRRAAFVHPEGRVRRAALEAAVTARDPEDLEALLDVARLDPDPLARARAFAALAGIGGGSLANRLHDRFPSAGEEERLAIIDVWASPGVFLFGGRQRLSELAFGGPGYAFVGLVAAERLSRSSDEHSERAHVLLERAALEGPLAEQRFAVLRMSLSRPTGRAALDRLLAGPSEELRILAAARLLETGETRERGLAVLRTYEPRPDELGRRARAALSVVGKPEAPSLLRASLRDPDPTKRASAGRALLRLGRAADTAILLADPVAEVRENHACSLLARTR